MSFTRFQINTVFYVTLTDDTLASDLSKKLSFTGNWDGHLSGTFSLKNLGSAIAEQPKQGSQNGPKQKAARVGPVGDAARFHPHIG